MNETKYLVISVSEDGVYVGLLAKGEIEKSLNEEDFPGPVRTQMPTRSDPCEWPPGVYVFPTPGLTAPTAKEVVTRWVVGEP